MPRPGQPKDNLTERLNSAAATEGLLQAEIAGQKLNPNNTLLKTDHGRLR